MQSLKALEPVDYLVIGHITKDLTPHGPKMGGTASYAALTARMLGLRVGVITSWGEEIPLGRMADVEIVNLRSEQSTTFENIYTPNGRLQVIHHIARTLDTQSLPPAWAHTPIIHLGPIAQEVDLKLAAAFPHSLVGATPQGWLRTWDQEGHIVPTHWEGSSQVLKSISVAILSIEDVGGREDLIQEMASLCPIFVVTEGYYGARVYWHGDVRRFSAPKVTEIDATGAGDIFAASFLFQVHKTRDPWEAARFANLLASQSVTRSGLASIPTADEVQNATIEVL
jgi:sugar/nucleoside kinase (ribokinase family)